MGKTLKSMEWLDARDYTAAFVPGDLEPRLVWLGLPLAGSCRGHLDLA